MPRTAIDGAEQLPPRERQERLELLGRMAAELAHELRNPLGGIRLHAGLLADDLRGTPQEGLVDRIHVGVAALEATIANMLHFTEPREPTHESLALSPLVEETCDFVQLNCAARSMSLRRALEPNLTVAGHAESLRQVLLNLVGNAIEASRPGDTLSLALRREGGEACLVCVDQGAGIAAEDLPHVFEPFFTRSAAGHGLGLPIVRRIVEQHGGTIRIDSEPGSGTCVEVRLPLEDAS